MCNNAQWIRIGGIIFDLSEHPIVSNYCISQYLFVVEVLVVCNSCGPINWYVRISDHVVIV